MAKPTKKSRKTPDELRDYRRKRDFSATPEPAAEGAAPAADNRFVVQEHSATRLHWDLRLERDGVAVSWAVPNGIPEVPGENRMAVHTEDHPLEYLTWEGVIPKGNYGAGTMKVWDSGTYDTHEWTDTKATVTFHGEQVQGRYHLFHIGGREGNDWMIRRVDPPVDPDREPMPEHVAPLLATPGPLPSGGDHAFAINWNGRRVIAFGEPGRLRLQDVAGGDVTSSYPELGRLTRAIGARNVVLDGELVSYGDEGRPDAARLERRAKPGTDSAMRRRARDLPIVFEIYDLLYLDGRSLVQLPWRDRQAMLRELELDGDAWRVSQHHEGDGAELLAAAQANGVDGIVAKPVDSPYAPGAWTLVGGESDIEVTDPDRVMYPKSGFTKADVAEYYRAVTPALLPHIQGRRLSMDDAELERHVSLALSEDIQRPTHMVFELGPGAPRDCAEIALVLRGMFEQLGLQSFAKTTGSNGLQVYVPLNSDVTYEQAKPFARNVAELLEQQVGKVPVDWSRNDWDKSTLAPYSLRAGERPTVSTPVTWEEVEAGKLDYDHADVVKRLDKHGDLFAPVLTTVQTLP